MCCINIHLTVNPFTTYCTNMIVTYYQNKMLYNKYFSVPILQFVDVFAHIQKPSKVE